jgi:hypothetical protein
MDNDPDYTKTDPSNRNSNKGILAIGYEQYMPLLKRMKQLNDNVYSIVQYMDSQ